MTGKSDNMEIVFEGWLTKSPPTKRIWRARWRKRWFVLRHSGELPGQYFLCYYTDRNCRKLKGQIDLDQCEQVDAGFQFENGKLKYQHMFDVKTPKRTYYLAAESEEEMNRWVDCVCHVCGLKAFSQEESNTYYDFNENEEQSTSTASAADSSQTAESSPPVSPTSTISGPYIPISECISGKPLSSPVGLNQFLLLQNGTGPLTPSQVPNNTLVNKTYGKSGMTDDEYDSPRRLRPPGNLDLRHVSSEAGTPPLQSPATDQESVFTDDESVVSSCCTNKPSVNWETFPRPSDSSVEGDLPKNALSANRRFTKVVPPLEQVPPPRPPKPSHLTLNSPTDSESINNKSPTNSENNESEPVCPNLISDETYDFPRSHQFNCSEAEPQVEAVENTSKHCYTNAAPGRVQGEVFRYDFALPVAQSSQEDLPESPRSETSSLTSNTAVYSNLPSPAVGNMATGQTIPTPPVVNRELKPGRKLSDSATSNEPSPLPPNVDRKLKPGTLKIVQDSRDDVFVSHGTLVLASPPAGSMGKRKPRAAPSPTPPSMQHNGNGLKHQHKHQSSSEDGGGYRTSPEDDQYIYSQDTLRFHTASKSFAGSTTKRFDEIQYLDLDLDSADAGGTLNPSTPPAVTTNPLPRSPQGITTATVYKTVDFLKTEAFNRTRQKAEEDRKQGTLTTAESS